jgi:hypothetical protein
LRRSNRPGALLICALACGRTSAPPAAPAPAWVEPAEAYAGVEIPVLLHGDGFNAEVVQQLSGGSHIALDASFRAFLDSFQLGGVRLIDSRTLAATVPATLPPGDYALSVEGPFGRGTAAGAFRVLPSTPAALDAAATAPARALVGQQFTVSVAVTNTGGMAALGVSAGTAAANGPPATVEPPSDSAVIAGGASHTFAWHATATAPGTLGLFLPVAGNDEVDNSPVSAAASASILIVTPAHLVATARPAPPSQPAGPTFQLTVDVVNDGGSDALGVGFGAVSGTAGIVAVVSGPAPQDIPAGATRTFVWTVRSTAEGTALLACSGAGVDSTDGSTVAAGPAQWTPIAFDAVALLNPTLSLPPGALPNETFILSLRLDNPGIVDALNVTVQVTVTVSGGSGIIAQSTSAPANVPAGGSGTFVWTVRASSPMQVRFDLNATGTDGRSGNPVTAAATGTTTIAIAAPVATDPFADGTSFAYVFAYGGRVWVGPSADGFRGVRMNFDGTAPEVVQFAFQTDPFGVQNAVSPLPAAFPSLGSAGCTPDSLQCGPDNEDGRGLLTAVTLGGTEWLFAGGAPQTRILKHVYLTTDVTASPQFPFVAQNPPGGTRGTTATAALGNALYVALADGGGAGNPVLLKMSGFPADSTQPLNPSIADALAPATLHSQGTGLIDSLIAFSGSLYAANDGGCARYNGTSWAVCTPSDPAWTSRQAISTAKTSDFVPADKAVPQMATYKGRLYLARNTTSGPQLWSCNPSSNLCGPGDWKLVPNQNLDPQLTQMDNASLTTMSLLVATSQHLYVGYDGGAGARLYRTNNNSPSNTDDFSAVSGAGLGAALTQLLDGQALSLGSREFLYLVARAGTGPAQVYRLAP